MQDKIRSMTFDLISSIKFISQSQVVLQHFLCLMIVISYEHDYVGDIVFVYYLFNYLLLNDFDSYLNSNLFHQIF